MTTPPAAPATSVADLVSRHLACPATHRPVTITGTIVAAAGSLFRGRLENDVAVMLENIPVSFFDDKFAVMQRGHDEKGGEWQFAYAQQVALLEQRLAQGGTVLDVGCGPALPYKKPAGALVIGLDYSLPSIAANHQVDLRVCASAAALPLADASVDTVVCFYSIHHMIGGKVAETESLVGQVLREFARVIKPGGEVLIFEMAPIGPFGWLERLVWNVQKRLLGPKLDMFFWPVEAMQQLAHTAAPGAKLEVQSFSSPAWTTFPPIFSLPWLRIPRFLYPLKPVVYRWQPRAGEATPALH